jgi:RNA polymerase sigma-70 factor (ECF subfamily)
MSSILILSNPADVADRSNPAAAGNLSIPADAAGLSISRVAVVGPRAGEAATRGDFGGEFRRTAKAAESRRGAEGTVRGSETAALSRTTRTLRAPMALQSMRAGQVSGDPVPGRAPNSGAPGKRACPERGVAGTDRENPRQKGNAPVMEDLAFTEECLVEDPVLVAAAQTGDTEAFDTLVVRHSPKLYGLVFHMTASHEDTDDLLQDLWAKVYRSLSGFRGASRFSTWVHSIAVHMTLNFLKKRGRRAAVSLDAAAPVMASSGDGTEPSMHSGSALALLEEGLVNPHTPRSETYLSELQARLTEALDQLSPEHRAVVTLFDVQGVPHAEIARVMGVSEGTVRSRLFYAHRQLQSLLSDMADEFLPAASAQAAS